MNSTADVKQPKQFNISLTVIGYVLGIITFVVLFFSSCDKASAEEMTDADKAYITSVFSSFTQTSNSSTLFQEALTNCPYFITYVNDGHQIIDFLPFEKLGVNHGWTGWYYKIDRQSTSYNSVNGSASCSFYAGTYLKVLPDNIDLTSQTNYYCYTFVDNGFAQRVRFKPYYYGVINYNTMYGFGSSDTVSYNSPPSTSNVGFGISDIVSNGDVCYQVQGISGSNGYAFSIHEKNLNNYVNDDRLMFAVVPDSYNNKYLWIDLSKFLDGTGSRISYDIETQPVIILDINDDIQSFSLPNIYLTNQTTNTSGTSNFVPVLRYKVPFSFFEFADDVDVTVTNFEFSLTKTNFTDFFTNDYKIACSFIMQTTTTNAPTGEIIASDPNTQINKITNITYNEIVDKINFQEGYYSPEGGGGAPLVVPDGYTVKYVTITGTRTLASIIQTIYDNFDITIDTARDVVQYVTCISQTASAEQFIENSVRDNHYTQSYDIIVYYWAPDASLGEVDVMFYYLTEAGRIRGLSQIAADIYKDVNQTAYNTYALYSFLYTRLNDFEDKTLASLYEQLGVSKSIQSSFIVANSTLTDILNAINGLDIPQPAVDYTSLLQAILQALGNMSGGVSDLSQLTGLITQIKNAVTNTPSTENMNFESYSNWLKGSPRTWAGTTFDIFKNFFESIDDSTSDFDPNESGVQTYIDTLLDFSTQINPNYPDEVNPYNSVFNPNYNIHDFGTWGDL